VHELQRTMVFSPSVIALIDKQNIAKSNNIIITTSLYWQFCRHWFLL